MNQQDLNKIISEMITNRIAYAKTFGTDKLTDINYMLVSDALSENIELLTEITKEQLCMNISNSEVNRVVVRSLRV